MRGDALSEKKRNDALLLAAAEALEDGRDPFGLSFLEEHNVTIDECFALAHKLGTLARAYVALTPKERSRLVFRGAAQAVGVPADIVDLAIVQDRLPDAGRAVIEELNRIGEQQGRKP